MTTKAEKLPIEARSERMTRMTDWRGAATAVSLLPCLLASCLDLPTSDIEEEIDIATAQVAGAVANPVAKVRKVNASGSLCGARNRVKFASPESWKGDVSALVVDAKIDTFGSGPRPVTKDCLIQIEWDVPAGFQFQNVTSFIQEDFMEAGGTRAENIATYAFDGAEEQAFRWMPRTSGVTVMTHILKQWSPCSTSTKPVRLNVNVQVTVSGGQQGIYSLDGIDVLIAKQASWRRCGAA